MRSGSTTTGGGAADHPGRTGRANPARRSRALRPALALLLASGLPACGAVQSVVAPAVNAVTGGGGPQPGEPGYVRGPLGAVAAEEARAALVAREILSAGGTATDAAVAAGFALAVTLPSRAGLGGGGVCLVHDPARGATEAVVFPALGREGPPPPRTDRPAAVPQMARGLFLLHTLGGRRPFESLLAPAEQLARAGTPLSRALASDLAAVRGPLLADPATRAVFARGGRDLVEGDLLLQPELGVTLAQLRTAGVGDLHQGALARRLETAAAAAGGGLTFELLRPAVPRAAAPATLRVGPDLLAVPPTPGGAALAAALRAEGGGPAAGAGPVGASTGLVVTDREGGAVACAFSMNNLFGTGRTAPGLGLLLAAAPRPGAVEPPPLAVALARGEGRRGFRLAVAASGQETAPSAAALVAARHLAGAPLAGAVAGVPEPGRAVAVGCPRYLPGDVQACEAAVDPRGGGVALGSAGAPGR